MNKRWNFVNEKMPPEQKLEFKVNWNFPLLPQKLLRNFDNHIVKFTSDFIKPEG
jgi:hypothetical protein